MNADPLAALRPLHAPDPIGWWPPAPLWWLAGLLSLVLVGLGIRALWRHVRRNRYRRAAQRALSAAWRDAAGQPDRFAAQATQLLRRAALTRYGPAPVASLTGGAWLAFLDRSGRMEGFASGPGEALARAPYDPSAPCDAAALERLCRRWLRRHR
jgi:hypothetical protein